MATSSSIDGLVSGLDTTTLINNLMAIEKQPRDALDTRRTAQKSALDALKAIETKLGAASTAATALQRSNSWTLRTAISSDTNVAVATATAGASLGSLTFSVASLASAHSLVTGASVAGTDTVVASGGSVQLTVGGEATTVSVGGGTLAEVADAINAAKVGVRASMVNTGSGYRLQLSATTTGASSAFTVDSGLDGLVGGTVISSQGTDARITVGSGPGAYDITSATNAFSDVLPGVTIRVKTTTASPVTVDVAADADGLASKIQSMVDAVNSAISEVKTRTAYDPATKTAASLNGDQGARKVAAALTTAITSVVQQSALVAPGLAGISVDKNGQATFDRSKFLDSYAKDPAAVERLFVQGATTTGQVGFAFAGDRVAGGTYEVAVTSLATTAATSGFGAGLPAALPATMQVRIGDRVASYEITGSDDLSSVQTGLQAALDAAGLDITATVDGGALALTSGVAGTKGAFEVDWEGTGTWSPVAAVDAIGTIDGVVAYGDGTSLTVPATDTRLGGLSANVPAGVIGTIGTLTYEPGLAQRIISAVKLATDDSGYLAGAEKSRQSRIDALTTSIDSYDRRLAQRQETLKKQYAALEVALGNLKNQSSWLAGQLSSLSSSSSSSS